MLSYLRIRDLALIESIEIAPRTGLVVLTGETGAGKSILLDGLALLAGQRATLDQVRDGADEAVVEGVFEVGERPDVWELLHAEGLEEEEHALVVRRTLSSRGSRVHVNDRVVTVTTLRKFGDLLVDLAGQHESQSLLSPAVHLRMLDRFGGLEGQRREVAACHDLAVELHEQLRSLRADDRDRTQRADYLRFQIEEISSADLSAEEEAELAAERQRLRHGEELAAAAAEALELLWEREDSAVAILARAASRLAEIERLDPSARLGGEGLADSRYTVEEIARSLQRYADDLGTDPERLSWVEQRLAAIDSLRRKYGDSVAAILQRAEEAQAELDAIDNRDEEIERLTARLRTAVGEYDGAASRLSASRAEAARALEARIAAELDGLGMEAARFVVRLRPGEADSDGYLPPGATRRGYETVEFELAANPGESPRPLQRVASGGELSRVMLALKLAELGEAPPQTLVFDEIDAGIGGGRVAERLGERLAALGARHQVLVVTHLPQIAARAGSHFRVSKRRDGDRARVAVDLLDDDARVEELARMLGGVEVTESVRQHARDLLARL